MFSAKLLDHFRNPRHAGDLAAPAIAVEVANPACGDTLQLYARIEDGRVAEASFRVRGCTASIATASATAEWLTGRSLADLPAMTPEAIEALVDELPPESKHAAVLCRDGLRALARHQSHRLPAVEP